jgi:glycosyltransferase involved in cell wall biosynthesis
VGSSAVYFVPISDFQRRQNRGLINMQDVIHHGIDPEGFPPAGPPGKQDYLFSIGRITRDKGQDKAIEVARRTGSRLVVAGNVQNKKEDQGFFESLKPTFDLMIKGDFSVADEHYYDQVMRPILASDHRIIYVGEVNSGQKKLWYQHARATLFPIQWGEPFGLVLIESLASGTPVVAFRRGSVPEIVNHGKTGFVVDTLNEMIEAVKAIRLIDPGDCRRHVQDHFSINAMARKYASLYRQLLKKGLSCHETSP